MKIMDLEVRGSKATTSRKRVFYYRENVTGDDWRLPAITFCEAKIAGGGQLRKCDC